MKPKAFVVCLLLLGCAACASRTAKTTETRELGSPGSARLTVTILGLESTEGEVAVALYASARSFKDRSDAVAKARLVPDDGSAIWIVEGLDPGVYAVAAYHDLNANGKLDRSTLGPPDEPYGFSNDARGTFGPPGFDKAAFEIASGEQRIEIRLR